MASFIPPQFSKFGKSIKDLLSKKYDFDNQIATKHKSGSGVTVEAGGLGVAGAVDGFAKLNYKEASFGAVDLELKTKGKEQDQTGKVTLNKLAQGVEVILNGDARPAGGVDVAYQQDFFAVNAVVNSHADKKTNNIVASGSIGHDGLSVGASAAADFAGLVQDYNVATEYSQPDFTLTLKTAKKGDEIAASFFQKLSGATSVGTQFTHNPEDDVKKLAFGVEHGYDANTTFKSKVESAGILSSAIEHRLNKGPLLGVASSFNLLSKEPFAAQKFGLSLKFGDY